MSANAKARWRNKLAALQCVVGKRHGGCEGAVELHHVAEGSGLRHDYGLVPLCHNHHQGGAGLHGMGSRNFLRLYRPPGDSEYGLLIWTIEDMAKARMNRETAAIRVVAEPIPQGTPPSPDQSLVPSTENATK